MKKFIQIFLIIAFIFTSNSTVFAAKEKVERSMLEIREVQTRYFETTDSNLVAKAIINTLQDNGFIIQRLEPDLGYIKAKKEVKLKRTLKGRVVGFSLLEAYYATCLAFSFGINPEAAWGMYTSGMQIKNEVAPHTVIFDSNVDIETVGNRTKVRFHVIEKILENGDGYTTVKSSPRKVVRHYEPEIYQEFFNQVDKNLFLEKNI
jgi:hypothetical protein